MVEAVATAAGAAAGGSEEVAYRVRIPAGKPLLGPGPGGVCAQDEAQDAPESQEDGCVRAWAWNRESVLGGDGLAGSHQGYDQGLVRDRDEDGNERGKYIRKGRLCLLPAAAAGTEQTLGLAGVRDADITVVERSTTNCGGGGRRR